MNKSLQYIILCFSILLFLSPPFLLHATEHQLELNGTLYGLHKFNSDGSTIGASPRIGGQQKNPATPYDDVTLVRFTLPAVTDAIQSVHIELEISGGIVGQHRMVQVYPNTQSYDPTQVNYDHFKDTPSSTSWGMLLAEQDIESATSGWRTIQSNELTSWVQQQLDSGATQLDFFLASDMGYWSYGVDVSTVNLILQLSTDGPNTETHTLTATTHALDKINWNDTIQNTTPRIGAYNKSAAVAYDYATLSHIPFTPEVDGAIMSASFRFHVSEGTLGIHNTVHLYQATHPFDPNTVTYNTFSQVPSSESWGTSLGSVQVTGKGWYMISSPALNDAIQQALNQGQSSISFIAAANPQAWTYAITVDAVELSLEQFDMDVSNDPQTELRLQSRTITLTPGIEPALIQQAQTLYDNGRNVMHGMVVLDHMPMPSEWEQWKTQGVLWGSFLHDRSWVIGIEKDPTLNAQARLTQVLQLMNATSLLAFTPNDKIEAAVLGGTYPDWATVEGSNHVQLLVTFFPNAPLTHLITNPSLDITLVETLSPTVFAITMDPADIPTLLQEDTIQFIEPGPVPALPLMSQARAHVKADSVQQAITTAKPAIYSGYVGNGVRFSTDEGMDPDHEDFWDHDANGNRTTPAWVDCLIQGNSPNHGAMTAGIIAGRGWQSDLLDDFGLPNGGTRFQFRGIAPRARLDCYSNIPDVSNRSFQQGQTYNGVSRIWDNRIARRTGSNFHPHVRSVGNDGITQAWFGDIGYYSIQSPSKNEISVGKVSDLNLSWGLTSLGPTRDGRIKPDLMAPGYRHLFPSYPNGFLFEVDHITLNGPNAKTWDFSAGPQGWGDSGFWTRQNITRTTNNGHLEVTVLPPPYGVGWENRPIFATLEAPDGSSLTHPPSASDTVTIRYRLSPTEIWEDDDRSFALHWQHDALDHNHPGKILPLALIADGQWHTTTLNIGTHSRWMDGNSVIHLIIRMAGARMHVPELQTNGYQGAAGSSASAPVVAGSIAVLLEQLHEEFNVTLGDYSASPFWGPAPGTGVPWNATFKALLIQTAEDLAHIPQETDPNNPDTGVPTTYHQGPDYASGYGIINLEEASRVLASHTPSAPVIIENELSNSTFNSFAITVPENPSQPLKVTLAWDDPGSTSLTPVDECKLINDLNLRLLSPDTLTVHFPWTIDVPTFHAGNFPADPMDPNEITPARQDQANTCDSVEQVYIEHPTPGNWIVLVSMGTWGSGTPQSYSLILGTPPKAPAHLNNGKVVFVSDRASQSGVHPIQLYTKDVNGAAAPQPITSEFFPVKSPRWSANGDYLAYIVRRQVGPTPFDVLKIVDANGTLMAEYQGPTLGSLNLHYLNWSDDGTQIVFTHYDAFSDRQLSILQFTAPYAFGVDNTLIPLVPSGMGAAEPVFSPNGRMLYFEADGQLLQVPSTGGDIRPIYGNTEPITRAFDPSVSPDGQFITYNSEGYKDNLPGYQDEELLKVGLFTGVISKLTEEVGNQYARYVRNSHGEAVFQSSPSNGGNFNLFLTENGVRQPLDIADSSNNFDDYAPDWWKGLDHHIAKAYGDHGVFDVNANGELTRTYWNNPWTQEVIPHTGGAIKAHSFITGFSNQYLMFGVNEHGNVFSSGINGGSVNFNLIPNTQNILPGSLVLSHTNAQDGLFGINRDLQLVHIFQNGGVWQTQVIPHTGADLIPQSLISGIDSNSLIFGVDQDGSVFTVWDDGESLTFERIPNTFGVVHQSLVLSHNNGAQGLFALRGFSFNGVPLNGGVLLRIYESSGWQNEVIAHTGGDLMGESLVSGVDNSSMIFGVNQSGQVFTIVDNGGTPTFMLIPGTQDILPGSLALSYDGSLGVFGLTRDNALTRVFFSSSWQTETIHHWDGRLALRSMIQGAAPGSIIFGVNEAGRFFNTWLNNGQVTFAYLLF